MSSLVGWKETEQLRGWRNLLRSSCQKKKKKYNEGENFIMNSSCFLGGTSFKQATYKKGNIYDNHMVKSCHLFTLTS